MADSRPGDIFQPGDLLNNTYRIEEVLGRGGTSEVYKARNDISGRFVAIKVLKSEFSGDEAFLTLMRREEEIREIRHDAVVRYSENHRTPEGLVYLVMDHVDGPGLDLVLKQGGMGADDLVKVCRRVASGLAVAHGRRIIHRDLSPDNIILKHGRPEEAVIIDFGIAKDANPGAQTIVGNEFAGKYAYAAPEQLAGKTDARSDLYALGALLLATFRGKRPDPGANPMEVVQKKGQALDTSGVPEPLKSLIDRLAAPDPAQRFQTAEEVLRFIDSASADERTVIVPRAASGAASGAAPPTAPAVERPPVAPPTEVQARAAEAPAVIGTLSGAKAAAPAPAPRSKAGLWAVLALVLLGVGGGGAWYSGALSSLTAPALPRAEPYSLIVDKAEGAPPRAVGVVPSVEVLEALKTAVEAQGGKADLSLASGDIGPSWGADVLAVVEAVQKLDSFKLAVTGNEAAVSGATTDAGLQEAAMAAVGKLPGVLQGQGQIELVAKVPQFLTADDLKPVLAQEADCGDLVLVDPPALGYGKEDTIQVAGRLAKPEQQVALFDALSSAAPGRKVDLKIELLNPSLCQIETALPEAHDGPFRFDFGFGDRPDDNPSGRYFVGENPVIDLVIPAEVTTGYVSVAIVDVSGNVYHLLPNLNRPENSVEALRAGQAGEVKVRIAYPLADNDDPAHIAFTVDATTLGKSKVVVLQSGSPLFPEMRPTTESVGGYAQALKAEVEAGKLDVLSINSRILTSVAN
ncbi:serine/threonine protein kinase [Stagnihabitans tardus]|uniref:Protein kinase n=1 Tax=Stagnihabitans tardus TaxID=2699202 RepID=A0AAE4YEY7_9RHOB|nr:serine/threonine protein kinase [Stagnihabitans tardus]NBZ90098.1 protein kinase [Stagnihabitans tardus]